RRRDELWFRRLNDDFIEFDTARGLLDVRRVGFVGASAAGGQHQEEKDDLTESTRKAKVSAHVLPQSVREAGVRVLSFARRHVTAVAGRMLRSLQKMGSGSFLGPWKVSLPSEPTPCHGEHLPGCARPRCHGQLLWHAPIGPPAPEAVSSERRISR